MFLPKIRTYAAATSISALLALTACSGPVSDPDLSNTASSNSSAGDSTEPNETDTPRPEFSPNIAVVERDIALGGQDATAQIYPIVRSGEYAILTIDFTGLEPDSYVGWRFFLGNDFGHSANYMGVRLVDLVGDEIYFPAVDSEQKNVIPAGFVERGPQRLQLIYADPGTDAIGLFLPGSAYIEEVPIIEGDVPSQTMDPGDDPIDVSRVVSAEKFPFESFTRELDGAVETLTSTEEVVVTLGSDVLFDVDSDELSATAAAAVKRAADHLSGREPGTISVVGHTDDVLGADYNQKLSERRAEAVATELEKHIDTSDYPIETSGKGKSEPLVPNKSDENRAKNRRVTITLTSEITHTTDVDRSGELPEFTDGPSGTGAEGIEMGDETTVRHYRYTASAREVADHVIVDLRIESLDDTVDSSIGIGTLAGHWSYRGEDAAEVGRTTSGIQIMDGATRVFPLDHYFATTKSDKEIWLPVTDLRTLARLDGGQTRVFSMIYPRLGDDWDTLTIRALGGAGVKPFELTDIPIERQ